MAMTFSARKEFVITGITPLRRYGGKKQPTGQTKIIVVLLQNDQLTNASLL